LGVLGGARRDARVPANRIRRFWFSVFRKPNATRPTCLTMRLYPSVRNRRERDADFEAILALDLDDVTAIGGTSDSDPRNRFTLGGRLVAEHRYVADADLLESLSTLAE
jgi:hypothetical protein